MSLVGHGGGLTPQSAPPPVCGSLAACMVLERGEKILIAQLVDSAPCTVYYAPVNETRGTNIRTRTGSYGWHAKRGTFLKISQFELELYDDGSLTIMLYDQDGVLVVRQSVPMDLELSFDHTE